VGDHHVKAMYHSTALVRSYDAAVTRLGTLFGLRVLEYSEQTDVVIARNGGMAWIGDGSIEIGEPSTEGAAPDRFVRRTGGGMQGVALWVDDIAATVDHLDGLGIPMPVRMGWFGFTSPRATAGLQLEWSESTVEEDPRAGAPEPSFTVEPLVDVTHLAFVAAVVEDPETAARALADAFGTRVTFVNADAGPAEPVAGVDVGDCTLALHRFDPASSLATWGHLHDRPRVAATGLRVDDLHAARGALTDESVAILRDDGVQLLVAPSETGDVEIALVADLLPGDPRA
jgi:catechol 2,3-dioxygenase-like lactoylglutathione lyase family enzyme